MEWYFQPEQQKRYAAVCQTGLKAVLDAPEWKSLNSYNKHFRQRAAIHQRLLAPAGICGAARPAAGGGSERDLGQQDRTGRRWMTPPSSTRGRCSAPGYEIKRGDREPPDVPDTSSITPSAPTRSSTVTFD